MELVPHLAFSLRASTTRLLKRPLYARVDHLVSDQSQNRDSNGLLNSVCTSELTVISIMHEFHQIPPALSCATVPTTQHRGTTNYFRTTPCRI